MGIVYDVEHSLKVLSAGEIAYGFYLVACGLVPADVVRAIAAPVSDGSSALVVDREDFVAPSVVSRPELVGTVSYGSFINNGLPRGPNYARNQANRLKKKALAEEKKIAENLKAAEINSRSWRVDAKSASWKPTRTEEEEKLHQLRVKRQIIQEQRKLSKLESPQQMVEDAMRQIQFAEKCAKLANDSKVASWAQHLSSASAESLARSADKDFEKIQHVKVDGSSAGSVRSSRNFVSRAGKLDSVVADSADAIIERVKSGVSSTGRSVNSVGDDYTRADALEWITRYRYIEVFFERGLSHVEIARKAHISVAEVRKYARLCAEFKIKMGHDY